MGDYGISRFGKKNSAPGNGQCFLTAHFQNKKITRSLFSLHFQLKVSLTKSTNDLQFACSAVYHSLRHNLFVHTLRALKSWVLKQNWLIRLSALDGTPKQNTTWKSQYLWVKLYSSKRRFIDEDQNIKKHAFTLLHRKYHIHCFTILFSFSCSNKCITKALSITSLNTL